jgi:hypothetical protein
MSPEPLDYQSRERKPVRPRCPVCGSDRTVIGSLAGETGVGFKPRKLRKLFHLSGEVGVNAVACAACGAVTLRVDREELVDLAGDPEAPAT